MIFRNCAQITDEKIKQIGDEIESSFTEKDFHAFLESWSPWKKISRKENVVDYDDLKIDLAQLKKEEMFCPLLQSKPEKAISYKGIVYDYDAFVQQYEKNGKNPMNPREDIDFSLAKRVALGFDER